MIKRIIPVLVICSVLISAICLPAAAETIEDIYNPNETFGSYYLLEPTVFDFGLYTSSQLSGLSSLDFYGYTPTYTAAPSFSYVPPTDEPEDAFSELFGYPEWYEYVYTVSFDGNLYENAPKFNLQMNDGIMLQLVGNPILLLGSLRSNSLFAGSLDDNGLPFLFVLTLDLPSVIGTLITDSVRGNVEISVVCGIVPDVETLDYNDYVSNTVIADDLQTVTVTIPAAYSSTYIRTSDLYDSMSYRYTGASFVHDFKKTGVDNYVQHAVFGSPLPLSGFGYRGKALYVGNIPDGTDLNFVFSIRMESNENWLYQPEEMGLSFRCAEIAEPGIITRILPDSYEVVEMDRDGKYFVMTVKCSYTLENLKEDTEWVSFDCGFGVGVVSSEKKDVMFSFEDVELEFSISALAGMVNESQRNNKLLKEVSRQLEEQGKTLNEVLNGSPDMQDKADQITGNITDKVQQGNQMMDALDSVARPGVSDSLVLPDYVSGEMPLYLSSLVREFGETDLVFNMFTMAGLVMLASYILFGKKV